MKRYIGILLLFCFVAYFFLLWILLLRDGRAMYAIADFYPSVLPLIKEVELYAIKYGVNSIPTILFAFITVVSFGLYFLAFTTKLSVKAIVTFSILFQCITFFAYPSLATDIFSYMMSDRVATVYHKNVWLTKPQEFSTDPFSRLADWQYQPRVYGEVNQLFYNIVSIGGQNDLALTVFLYKLLVFLFSLASMYVVYRIAKKFYPGKEGIALLTIFWNPLFILEIVGSGHNDMLMIFFALLGIYFYKDKRWVWAALAFGAAVQVKIIIILLVGFIGIDLLRQKKILPSIQFSGTFILFNALMFFLMQISPLIFLQNISFNVGVYWQSLPLLVHKLYPNERIIFSIGFLLVILAFVLYQWRGKKDPITIYSYCMACYLLFFATAYWNWYVLWILAVIPFTQDKNLKNAVLIFSFTATFSYPLFWLALRFNHENIFWHIGRYLVLAGVPIFSFFYFLRFKKSYILSEKS